jgi:hypothetical protein
MIFNGIISKVYSTHDCLHVDIVGDGFVYTQTYRNLDTWNRLVQESSRYVSGDTLEGYDCEIEVKGDSFTLYRIR